MFLDGLFLNLVLVMKKASRPEAETDTEKNAHRPMCTTFSLSARAYICAGKIGVFESQRPPSRRQL